MARGLWLCVWNDMTAEACPSSSSELSKGELRMFDVNSEVGLGRQGRLDQESDGCDLANALSGLAFSSPSFMLLLVEGVVGVGGGGVCTAPWVLQGTLCVCVMLCGSCRGLWTLGKKMAGVLAVDCRWTRGEVGWPQHAGGSGSIPSTASQSTEKIWLLSPKGTKGTESFPTHVTLRWSGRCV